MRLILGDTPSSDIPHLQFTHLLKLFGTQKSTAVIFSWSFVDMRTVTKKSVSSLGHGAPAEAEQSNDLSSCFGSHRVNQCLFGGLVGVTFVVFLDFWLVILLFKVPPAQRGHDLPDRKKGLCYLNFVQARVTVLWSGIQC